MADQLIKRERKKAGIDTRGPQAIGEQRWNDRTGADKVLPLSGAFIKPYLGSLSGAGGVEVTRGKGSTVSVYNDSATTAYVVVGAVAADVSAVTPSSANGIAIPPYSYFYVSMVENMWIKSTANCLGYELDDDTYIAG